MNLLDLIIILIVAAYAVRGFATGFFRQAGSLGGLVVGVWLGVMLATLTVGFGTTAGARALLAVATVLVVVTIISGAGDKLGEKLAVIAGKLRAHIIDDAAGALLGGIIALVLIWVFANIFTRFPTTGLAAEIQNSAILQRLDKVLPPLPDVVARLEHTVAPNGFPKVFAGLEPSPAPAVAGPNSAEVQQALAAGRASTVKIEGAGCGGIVAGSGVIVAPGVVATNAHVVAGIDHPVIIDSVGTHPATVVSFDPDLDFAVLRASGLSGPALALSPAEWPRGTTGAVLGYPGGGGLVVSSAAILDEQTAVGRNIYNRGLVRRKIYELQAIVRPGNSGGPLLTPDGTVIGIVFAASTTNGNIGYALTSAEVRQEVVAAGSSAVTTGQCAAE